MTKALITIMFLLLSFTTAEASEQSVEGVIQSVNLKRNTLKLNNKKYAFDRYLKILLISAGPDSLSVNQLVKGMFVKLDYERSAAKGRKINAITLLIH